MVSFFLSSSSNLTNLVPATISKSVLIDISMCHNSRDIQTGGNAYSTTGFFPASMMNLPLAT